MKAIIFGINGQDGFYLQSLLQQQGIEVIGISRHDDHIKADITSFEDVQSLVKEYQPAFIFHLAANSTTRHEVMFENHQTISTGTLNILEAVRLHSPHAKVFISGSGLQFFNNNQPIKETDPFEARDAYSVSRIQSVYAARYFRSRHGIKTYVGYFFNHDSPRRSERHVAQKIARAAKQISMGSNERLLIGDINTIKEWTFAGDVVEGIWCLVNQDKVFEANLGSGIGYSIANFLTECFSLIGKNWKDYVDVEKEFEAEYKQLVSDSSLIQSLGWKPKTSLKQLAQLMLEQA
ncbi:MAG: NAD-dependent epimerase/dehydratase family protein [Sphingobacteriales bacterium]|nr:MAG: NAD-dependent epimerase/dehydratase family protein [Sphingobacteriales bacterium]